MNGRPAALASVAAAEAAEEAAKAHALQLVERHAADNSAAQSKNDAMHALLKESAAVVRTMMDSHAAETEAAEARTMRAIHALPHLSASTRRLIFRYLS